MDDEFPACKLPSAYQPKACENAGIGFKCDSCGMVFALEQDLEMHNARMTKDIHCPLCSIKFVTYKGMRQHYGKRHAKIRPYRCNICYKRFRNVYASRIHKQQVHLHKARQDCMYCGKSVYNKYSLSRHLSICNKKTIAEDDEELIDV